jgi:hypothetical protein
MKEGGVQAFMVRRGAWRLRYHPTTGLELRHTLTGTRLHGALSFTVGGQAWTLTRSRDEVPDRPAWLDAQGNVQGYLGCRNDGDRLEIMILHRCAQSYRGVLRFDGVADFGTNSFACRAHAPRVGRVVQMAAGPADSRLNDALFDIDSDALLCFGGDTVEVSGEQASGFRVQLTAEVADAARSVIILDLQRHFYATRYVPHYRPINKARCPTPPTGWMSWNVYFDTAGAAENLAEARFGARHLRPFGMEFWSIESWQANSDRMPVAVFHNLDLNCHAGQFPDGMKKLADDLRALGFRPGIWTVPFGTGDKAFYETHREWFLHHDDGTPMRNWSGLYVLDPSQTAVRDHMCEMHRVMSQEWGYEFFKVDGMSGRQHSYSAHFFERDEVRRAFRHPCPNPLELCVQAVREGMGPNRVFLACQGHYTGPEAGVADAARIGGDIVAPNQPSTWENVRSQASSTLSQLFVNNILWYCDPDTLLVGSFHGIEQARVTATVVALPGQLMFAGDKLAELPPERLRLLQQALPVCDVRPLDLFPIFDLRPVWDLKIRRPFGQWDVVALFNWSDEAAEVAVTLAELGLPPDQPCLLYEFWESRFCGRTTERISLPVPARAVRLVAVHPDLGRPQFLSTDRHLTQGATSIAGMTWDEAARTLALEVKLVGGHATRLRFAVPPAYRLNECSAEAGATTAVLSSAAGVLDLEVSHHDTRNILVTLRF